ncbi:MAG: ATP-binding protein [Eubacteriaceae bacterium]|nr:ATP-binding protein [Eubacteriaceae bacterium]
MLYIQDIMKSYLDSKKQQKIERDIASKAALASLPGVRKLLKLKSQLWMKCLAGEISEEKCVADSRKIEARIARELRAGGYEPSIIEQRPICETCSDTGYTKGKVCKCLKSYVANELTLLDNSIQSENFEVFDASIYSDDTVGKSISDRESVIAIRAGMERFIEDFDDKSASFLFTGPTGSGKTFMANCVAFELISQCKPVMSLSARTLVEIMGSYGSASFEDSDAVYASDLLIIDDLGMEGINDYSGSIIYNVVNDRLLSQKSTIVATVLATKEIANIYHPSLASRLLNSFSTRRFPSTTRAARHRKLSNGESNEIRYQAL